MRQIPRRQKISDVGLKKWLNTSKQDHNGHGYDRFVEMLTSELKYTKAQMATEFNVNRETIYMWIGLYEEESDNVG